MWTAGWLRGCDKSIGERETPDSGFGFSVRSKREKTEHVNVVVNNSTDVISTSKKGAR